MIRFPLIQRSALCAAVALNATLAAQAQTPASPPQASKAPKPAAATAAPLDPLTQRLCAALDTQPLKCRSECCPSSETSHVAPLCGQQLSAAIRRGSARIEAAAVDRCVQETRSTLEGCGWVNPLLPPLPEACGELVQDTLP